MARPVTPADSRSRLPLRARAACVCASLALALSAATPAIAFAESAEAPGFAAARRAMLDQIRATAEFTGAEVGRSSIAPEVMEVMGRVPRHRFVPDKLLEVAYVNRPLPIGHGQTISQPYIVALMTELLEVDRGDRILEVGTGSAYQAAVLAELVAEVYTMEIIEPLAQAARARLEELGYANVEVSAADGYYGWPEHAPFDGIIVTAAASHIPPPLVEQLKPGGRMVIPVGARFAVQHLLVVHKRADGEVQVRQVLPVRFVPLTGGHD
ncbi:MAG: protein-L-isoaspartate(D-aspartate) O-methyltransferase [Gammaproteobacteria bacterium]|nr:protein-L-isoaspartate(D-aspartate) O-methyltransferase [Gammaproteobacteria bacterium]